MTPGPAHRRSRTTRTRGTVLAGVVVVATAVAFWQLRIVQPVRLPQNVRFWNGDLYNIYYPAFVFAYRGGQFLPRWNPWQLAGTPFLAGYNGGFLYPPNWIATVVPVHLALGWLCAGHLAFAGVATLAAARALALSWPAAFVAGLTFMLSGRLAIEAFWPSYLAAHAWIPAVALAAGLLVRAPGAWRGAVLGAVLALQFLTGIAQHAVYEGYLLALAGAAAWLRCPRVDAGWLRRLGLGIVAAGATALGLAAVQLVPTLEVVAAAPRGQGLPLADAGIPASALAEVRAILASTGPAVGLVVLGLAGERRRWVVAAGVVVVVSVLFAVGSPVFTTAFTTLPGVDLFRLPHRIVPIATFALALLAARGLDRVRRRLARSRSLTARLLGVSAIVGVGAFALGRPTQWAGASVLVAVAALVFVRGPRLTRAAAWAIVAAVAVDRFAAARNTVMLTQNNDEAYFSPPPFVDVLRRDAGSDRVLIVKDWNRRFPHMEKAGELWGFHVAGDYEPLLAEAYRAFLYPVVRIPPGHPFDGRMRPWPVAPGWRMLDLLAVRWVVVPPTVRWGKVPAGRFRRAYAGPDATIYENLRGMPRAYLARRILWVPDRAAALAAVTAPRFDPTAAVVLERADGPAPEPQVPAGAVRVVSEANDEIVLHADTATGGVLVLTDLHWPGWHATVDGTVVPILRANYLFRAVRLDAGSHEIRFRYDATRFRAGAFVSLVTLAVLSLAWWHAPREDPR